MSRQHQADRRSTGLALAAVLLLVSLTIVPTALASGWLLQTIPTRTPPYTVPPGPTNTAGPPSATNTSPPGPTVTPPVGTATLPGSSPPPPNASPSRPAGTPVTPGATVPARPSLEPTAALACSAAIGRADVLPGEGVEYALLITNRGSAAAASVILWYVTAPGTELVRVSATQGAVDVQAGQVTLRLGFVESAQSVLAILDLRAHASAMPGQVFLQQATIYFDGGQAQCNVVAFGTRPDRLPATGAARRLP